MLGVVVAVAAAAAIYVSVQANRDSTRAANRASSFAASTAAGQLVTSIHALRTTVLGVAASLRGRTIPNEPTSACSLSDTGTDALPQGHVDILRPTGLVVCSSRPQTGGRFSYAGAAWLARARSSPLFLAPSVDAATGHQAIVATAPVPGQGIVAAFADLEPVAKALASRYGGGRAAEFLVMSADGRTVISRSIEPARWTGREIPDLAFAPAAGSARRDLDGTTRLYEEAPVSGVGWRFYVGEDRAQALAAGTQLRDRQLWIILGGLALILFVAFLIYRRVALPIKRLAAAVGMADPDAALVSPAVSGPAEVAALAGNIDGFIASIQRETAQRRQLEEQLMQAQKMDALGRVTAGIAHDFNNLVSVIAGFTSLILRSAQDDPALRANAEEVHRAAERAAGLIRQLLLFSRKETSEPKVLDANDVVAEMQTMLARILGSRIELEASLASRAIPIRADRGKLEQVLMNLCVNARDAMPQGGRLTLATRTCSLDDAAAKARAVDPGEFAVIDVVDNGSGMDEETRERLFEPFFTTKPSGQGTGLGLATCYGIVSQLRGRIDVVSAPGEGSTFSVYLPLSDDAVEGEPSRAAQLPSAGAAETILLVEDDDGVRTLARIVLEEAGYRVLDAREGSEALAVAGEHTNRVDLLVTDGAMASIDGVELARRLCKLHPEARVLYISGYERESIHAADPIPESEFLAKPFTPDDLLTKVRQCLDAEPHPRAR